MDITSIVSSKTACRKTGLEQPGLRWVLFLALVPLLLVVLAGCGRDAYREMRIVIETEPGAVTKDKQKVIWRQVVEVIRQRSGYLGHRLLGTRQLSPERMEVQLEVRVDSRPATQVMKQKDSRGTAQSKVPMNRRLLSDLFQSRHQISAHGLHPQHDAWSRSGFSRPGIIPNDGLFLKGPGGRFWLLQKKPVWDGSGIESVAAGFAPALNVPAISVVLTRKAGERNREYSRRNIKKHYAIVHSGINAAGKKTQRILVIAIIQAALYRRFEITGLESAVQARDVARSLKLKPYPVTIRVIAETIVRKPQK